MKLIPLLKAKVVRRGFFDPATEIDPATAFTLVRDMPYRRASDHRPETIIAEWQGTCSGKISKLPSHRLKPGRCQPGRTPGV